jgi:hypothetical protein
MNTNRNTKARLSTRLPLLALIFGLGMISLIISCEIEDDTPPPSAYVAPEPLPVVEGCPEDPVVNDISTGVDFECGGPEISFFGEKDGSLTVEFIDNPDASGINTSEKVVEYIQTAGVEPWAGFFFDLTGKVDFSVNQGIKLKVYSSAAEQTILLKLEDSADGAINKEVMGITTVANAWEELTFNFSSSDSDKYDRLVLFFDFNSAKDAPTTHYFDDIILGEAGETPPPVEVEEPTSAAPVPILPEADVISIYSDTYTPITVSELPTEWSGSDFEEIQIEGNNTIKYSNLDFTGIVTDYGNPTDLTAKSFVHFDYWTADGTELGIKLVNTGVDPAQEDLESVGTVIQGQWVSVDIALDDFAMDRSQVTQILFDNLVVGTDMTVYIDNLYFHNGQPTGPTTAAPTPTFEEADVISIYSDTYTPITVSELPTEWSGSGFEEIQIEGNNTIKYFDLDFTGIVTDYGNPTDLTAKSFVHFDYWTLDGTELGIKLVNTGVDPAQEDLESVGTVIQGQWVSVDIALDDFAMDRSQVTQILFDNLVAGDASITVYIDNLYFHNGQPTGPTTAAPTPTVAEADVISVFSDSYTDVAGTDFNPNWGQATVVTQVDVAGDNTLKYENLNYQGTQFASALDVSGMSMLHIDYWTADSSALNGFLISSGPSETAHAFAITTGEWVSVDIPLTEFSDVVDLMDVIQMKFDGNGTIYLDNIYFYQ